MKSPHSNSLVLVWRVAEVEAKRLNAHEIEPIHLLIGLCKTVDLDLPELISKDRPDRDDVLEELLREVRRLRTVFRTAQVKVASLRRKLRGSPLDRRFTMPESQTLHRSIEAKKVFADAEHFAQITASPVYPVHLLYATLLADDKPRDAILTELSIEKKRLMSASKREVVMPQLGSASASKKARTRWN